MAWTTPARLALALAGIIAVFGGAAALKGGLYVTQHEGDTLHLVDIVLRMAAGQVPHLDFMTPLGALAFAPIAGLVRAGLGVGQAILWSQILVAAALAPAAWWVARDRLSGPVGLLFAAVTMVMVLALTYGEADRAISISMHYNRWAWAIAFVAVLAAAVPPRAPRRGLGDGVVVGLAMAALVMIKVTYFVALLPAVAVGLWVTGQRRALAAALVAGLVVAGLLTAWLGPGYWLAYAGDLLAVSDSEIRPRPGDTLTGVLAAPANLGATMLGLAGVVLLRQAGVQAPGLVLLVLLPGVFYVTYQNFGNDPQWLLLLGVLLLALRPRQERRNALGWPLREALGVTAAMALALGGPSFVNLVYSPARHLSAQAEEFQPMLALAGHGDLMSSTMRNETVFASTPFEAPGLGITVPSGGDGEAGDLDVDLKALAEAPRFQGEELPRCAASSGMVGVFRGIARGLSDLGVPRGARVYGADLLASYWLFAELAPLGGGAPWYYGGLPGFADAGYLVVPLCPVSGAARTAIVGAIEARDGAPLAEVGRNELFILYRMDGSGGAPVLGAAIQPDSAAIAR